MNHPKFEVGEEVILESKKYPDLSGEYSIHQVLCPKDEYICRISGVVVKRAAESEKFVYLLDKPLCSNRIDIEALVRESSLRKKHKPAEMSFSALMQSLTSPVGAAWKELDGTIMQRKMSV